MSNSAELFVIILMKNGIGKTLKIEFVDPNGKTKKQFKLCLSLLWKQGGNGKNDKYESK